MGWDRRLLLDRETQSSDSATRRQLLPRGGILSGLEIHIRITNGATAGEEHVVAAIDRIEVVADGSNVLFSLEGVEAHRWGWLLYGAPPPYEWDESAAAVQELVFPVLFGRYFGDDWYGLDLKNFRDVELRVQFSPTISATAFATGTVSIHVVMWVSDDGSIGATRRGYLRTTQVRAFISAASGEEIIEMARLYPFFDIGIYAREATIEDGVDITRAEVRVNDRKLIPFVGTWDDIQNMNEKLFRIDTKMQVHALRADNATIDMLTGRIRDSNVELVRDLAAGADFNVANVASFAGDRITLHMIIVEASATYAATILETTRREMFINAEGAGVGNFIVIPFALHGNPDLALDAPSFDRLQLALTNGGAGGDVRVSTREIVPG